MPTAPSHEEALENPVLEQADEDDKVTSLESRIAFKYNHAAFAGDSRGDYLRLEWVQAFGPSKRMAVRVELPLIHVYGATDEPNANGVGDILLEFIGMLGKTEKFEHTAALEVTVPSANDALAPVERDRRRRRDCDSTGMGVHYAGDCKHLVEWKPRLQQSGAHTLWL
jgi:hypothetical protein